MICRVIVLLVPPLVLTATYLFALLLAFLTVDMPARAIFGRTEWWNGLQPLACVAVALLARALGLRFLNRARAELSSEGSSISDVAR